MGLGDNAKIFKAAPDSVHGNLWQRHQSAVGGLQCKEGQTLAACPVWVHLTVPVKTPEKKRTGTANKNTPHRASCTKRSWARDGSSDPRKLGVLKPLRGFSTASLALFHSHGRTARNSLHSHVCDSPDRHTCLRGTDCVCTHEANCRVLRAIQHSCSRFAYVKR